MNLARLLRPRPDVPRHAHRVGPDRVTVAMLRARVDSEHAAETTRIIRLPKPRASERTAPLLRCGDAATVFEILGGRGLDEREITDHSPQDCEWCETEAPAHRLIQPTSVRITGDNAHTECCITPECFHAALAWVHHQDETSDTDIVVEIARRQAVAL
ncbi:hypothetical protein [Amycolatopsis pigmentata]|uniref:Uncharacterized protein n=1 Tax=Amycolatopsis pigmentata TaxID=450801 RepID=A0ABW5G7A9_9PSEU